MNFEKKNFLRFLANYLQIHTMMILFPYMLNKESAQVTYPNPPFQKIDDRNLRCLMLCNVLRVNLL